MVSPFVKWRDAPAGRVLISQVERGVIRQPDPIALLELAQLYRLDFLTLARWAGWASESAEAPGSISSASHVVRQILELDESQRAHVLAYIQDLTKKDRS